ncbi:MAG: hypothetical protein JO019_04460 [Candidatus Kaiserbacteria bacterium]|nr:hypothetical protein [Candidatus Kaiserbacteria bacterium]
MNNNNALYWVGGIIVVVLLGAFLIFGMKGSTSSMNSTSTGATTSNASAPQSLKALLTSQTPQTCTFSSGAETGTVFVASGKARGDFSTSVNGKAMSAHMISDGTTVYTWMDGMSTGYKVSINASAAASSSSSQSFNANQTMDYHCSPWSADNAKFQMPAGVTFTDVSAMMKASTGASGSVNACSTCDLAPAAQKAQCRAALGCK